MTRPFDFNGAVTQLAWKLAKYVPGRDPSRWRFDVLEWPILKPCRSQRRGLLCYQYDHIVAPTTSAEMRSPLFKSIHNCQILSACGNQAKSTRVLTLEELKKYQFRLKPTKGMMDLAELINFGNVLDEHGNVTQVCYTVEQARLGKLLSRNPAAATIPADAEMNQIFCEKSASQNDHSVNFCKSELRKEIGLNPDLPAVILKEWPGEGLKNIVVALGDTLTDKGHSSPIGQLVIISEQPLHYQYESNVPMKVIGADRKWSTWIGAGDCIVSTAEPEIINKVLGRGVLVVIGEELLGQDTEVIGDALKAGLAMHPQNPKDCAELIKQWCLLQKRLSAARINSE